MRPKHTKSDIGQPEMMAGLRALGFLVLDVHDLAHLGFDLLVCGYNHKAYRAEWLAVEVKSSKGAPLTPREEQMQAVMVRDFGPDPPIIVAWCIEQILRWYGAG